MESNGTAIFALDVIKYFKKNFVEYYLIFGSNAVEKNQKEKEFFAFISENIIKKSKSEEITDSEINVQLKEFVKMQIAEDERNKCKDLYEKIKELLEQEKVFSKTFYGSDICDHIIKMHVAELFSQYDTIQFDSEDFKKKIVDESTKFQKKLLLILVDRIKKYLNTREFSFFNELHILEIKESELISYVANMMLIEEDRDSLKLISSNAFDDNMIQRRTYSKFEKHIDHYVEYRKRKIEKKEKVNENMSNVEQQQFRDNDSVQSSEDRMLKNSVKNNNQPKRIKKKSTKKSVNRNIIALLVVATLFGSAYGVSRVIKENGDNRAIAVFESVDGFDYNSKYLINDEYVDSVAKNVVRLYLKFSQLDSNLYKTLGFYSIYEGYNELYEKTPSLDYMEKLFAKVREEVREYEDCRNFDLIVKANSDDLYCYLDFVYDRLAELGHDEVYTDKYQYALTMYKFVNFGDDYVDLGVKLSAEQNKIIQEVMGLYYKYCAEAKLEVGYIMTDGEHTFFEVEGIKKGGK